MAGQKSPLLWGADFVEAFRASTEIGGGPHGLRSCGERTSLRRCAVRGPCPALWCESPLLWGADFVEAGCG